MRRKEKEINDIGEIELIISKCDVCRIGFASDNVPYIVTMNFGYSGGNEKKLYFHCASEGRKLEMIKKNHYVCFEMDTDHSLTTGEQACDCSMEYSSVVGYGHISVVKEREEKIAGFNSIMSHYSTSNEFKYNESSFERSIILRLDIQQITGKRG